MLHDGSHHSAFVYEFCSTLRTWKRLQDVAAHQWKRQSSRRPGRNRWKKREVIPPLFRGSLIRRSSGER
eukprot:3884616-Rhodomonas_salina.3